MIRVSFPNVKRNNVVELGSLLVGSFFVLEDRDQDLKMIILSGRDAKSYLRMNCPGDGGVYYNNTRVIHVKDINIIVNDNLY